MAIQFKAVCGPKLMPFWDDVACRRTLVVVNGLNRLSMPSFVPKIWAVKVIVKLRSRPKRFLAPAL